MKITRTSRFSGREREMDLPITQEQMDRYNGGALVQDVFPLLSHDHREFIISGVTPEEWNELFGGEE